MGSQADLGVGEWNIKRLAFFLPGTLVCVLFMFVIAELAHGPDLHPLQHGVSEPSAHTRAR